MQCQIRARPAPGSGASSATLSTRAVVQPSVASVASHSLHSVLRGNAVVCSNWKTFGPKSHHSDGDAEFYKTSSRLSQQYEWFAPRQQQEEESNPQQEVEETEQQQQQRRQRPEFGLSTKQIAALGLSGTQSNLPNPVSADRIIKIANTKTLASDASVQPCASGCCINLSI